jgi:hypothetical protein
VEGHGRQGLRKLAIFTVLAQEAAAKGVEVARRES